MAMQEPTFLVLTALAGPPLHGYAIMRAAAELPGGMPLRAGTLYAALDRLTAEGLVEVAGEEQLGGGRVRRSYRLTGSGATALRAETARRRDLLAVATDRLAALRPRPA
ncbi:PadR family transcriptional regulator [Actinocatenispora rupis]|uniref:PadR family transcriptional regulator n=1 Tax=Actinocatenispora rupis TaxID=519421 RepID=A0A8J3N8B1_9ACTN|nr:PadR family transcriptional regulator [Actinocatenispora rupis]GID09891.1 PadR family transcriptional regulator [Actinocatenispora rupis]